MADSTATPLPAPDAGGNPSPELNVLPEAPVEFTERGDLNKKVEESLKYAADVCRQALKPMYFAELVKKQIDAPFVHSLEERIALAGLKAQAGVSASSDSSNSADTSDEAKVTLISTLQVMQKAARQQYLPAQPAQLKKYHVGTDLGQSKSLLEGYARDIITESTAHRLPGVDTEFLLRADAEKKAYAAKNSTPQDNIGSGEQARAQRDELVRGITADRKKIQYAADALWPEGKPENVEARKAFRLPKDRPYSY